MAIYTKGGDVLAALAQMAGFATLPAVAEAAKAAAEEIHALRGKLDICKRYAEGEALNDASALANDYGGTGWEQDPACAAVGGLALRSAPVDQAKLPAVVCAVAQRVMRLRAALAAEPEKFNAESAPFLRTLAAPLPFEADIISGNLARVQRAINGTLPVATEGHKCALGLLQSAKGSFFITSDNAGEIDEKDDYTPFTFCPDCGLCL